MERFDHEQDRREFNFRQFSPKWTAEPVNQETEQWVKDYHNKLVAKLPKTNSKGQTLIYKEMK